MKDISPLYLLPVSIAAFLGGAALGRTQDRRRVGASRGPVDPMSKIPLVAWERFVTVMAIAPKRTVTPRGRLGYFGLDARRLADVGFMRTARKATVGGETGVWTGEWQEPLSTEKFLESAPAQYAAFKRSMKSLAPKVGAFVGCDVDGVKATLSGLLGVGHLAGEAGVASWVASPEIRKKFASTTANFHKANHIF